MKGLTFSNSLIARDEALHTEFGVALFRMVERPPSAARIHEIARQAVDAETVFVDATLGVDGLPGLSSSTMITYVQHTADNVLRSMGVPPLYDAPQPLPYMVKQGMLSKDNFFEKRVSEYSRAGVGRQTDSSFGFDEAF